MLVTLREWSVSQAEVVLSDVFLAIILTLNLCLKVEPAKKR